MLLISKKCFLLYFGERFFLSISEIDVELAHKKVQQTFPKLVAIVDGTNLGDLKESKRATTHDATALTLDKVQFQAILLYPKMIINHFNIFVPE